MRRILTNWSAWLPYLFWTIVLGLALVGGLYVANAVVEAFATWATRVLGG